MPPPFSLLALPILPLAATPPFSLLALPILPLAATPPFSECPASKRKSDLTLEMEFFLPGLFFFVITILITSYVAPRITPFVASLLSIAFLSYGVYHHYTLFAAEYRLSTWQEGLKVYSPAIMILAVILFILYGILAFFTSAQVPVPSMLNLSLPSANSLTNQLANSMESMGNSMVNSMNHMISANKSVNQLANQLGINTNPNKNKNKNNISRSFLETV